MADDEAHRRRTATRFKKRDAHSVNVASSKDNYVADGDVMPVRGQVVRVRAPWIQHYYNSNGEAHIIPNLDTNDVSHSQEVSNFKSFPP